MKRLFGTDGVRGAAGEYPLDPATVARFGAALAEVLAARRTGERCRVILGRDTRESGPWLRDAVAAGLRTGGVASVDVGVVPTPGLAHLLREDGFDAGVMISASHNPFGDNGLKVFDARGVKLSDDDEQEMERRILDESRPAPEIGSDGTPTDEGRVASYVDFLAGVLEDPQRLRGLRLVLDCAHGAAAAIAPALFRKLGAEVDALGTAPDGRNINLGCGSLHLEGLAEHVRRGGFDAGLAFDGDADRCLGVDRRGRTIDGDRILYLVGRRLERSGRLTGNGVVATIMSNLWLEERLAEDGIRLHRAAVGDKYVLERMLDEGLALGGEQSGHVIFRELATTGDGMLTALLLLDAALDEPLPLDEILAGIVPYPQQLRNVRVREKPDLGQHPEIGPALAETERRLGKSGRVVLRYSGTEPLVRVMIEGRDPAQVETEVAALADCIERHLGA